MRACARGAPGDTTTALGVDDFAGVFIVQAIGVGAAIVVKVLVYVVRRQLGGRFGIDPPVANAADAVERSERKSFTSLPEGESRAAIVAQMRAQMEAQMAMLDRLAAVKEEKAPAPEAVKAADTTKITVVA